ncbi:GNAT family N-acetyltransferase [Parasphingorhabdus halotolerans]|uniref:GNAT family N-acetyltransferase n=1 Tax=Parasphingorhabdus halotolerans TaxID=2725558 RepID=A0A6H2DPC7_9SPHN|nr:GNAT family N-acetyltransferase [Parasphingorhabdus halotolerans]QJB69611.1 GNAT family N-acetyltransferase [Parasphingorhabdus halotolerans]
MKIAVAQASDIRALHLLVESAYRGDSAKKGWTHEADLLGGQRTDLASLKTILDDPGQAMLTARDYGDGLIGCVQLERKSSDTAYLGMLTVHPDIQAKGLGKELLAASEEFVASQWQVGAIEMTVIKQRLELIAYYERRGYAMTGEKRPFPLDDPKYGMPKTRELEFLVLRKAL